MRDDLKAALRSLRSSKDVALAALIILTLGIGATTAIFSPKRSRICERRVRRCSWKLYS